MNEMTQVLGTVAMEPKGEWSSETYYVKLNTVLYNDSTYMAKEGVVGEIPSESTKWQLIGGGVTKEYVDEQTVDSLDSTSATRPLSANQGKVLDGKIDKKPYYFDTVALMKAATLKNGDYVITKGYYTAGDGGGAEYYITNTSSSSVYQETIGSLYATLIIDEYIKPEQLGAYGDETHDDSDIIIEAVNKFNRILFTKKYKISKTINLKSNIELKGAKDNLIFKDSEISGNYAMFYSNEAISNVILDGLNLKGLQLWTGQSLSGDANEFAIRIKNGNYITIKNCYMLDFGGSSIDVISDNLLVENNEVKYTGSFTGSPPNYNFGISYEGTNCKITKNKISGVIQGIIAGLENENVIISENDISTKGQHGIYIESANKLNIVNNIVHECELAGIKVQLNNVELQDIPYEDIIISNNNIKNCKAQGVLITNILEYATFKNFVVSSNIIKDCTRGIDIEQISSINVVNNYIETTSTKEYGIFINKCDNFNIVSNTLKLVNTPLAIYLQDDTTGTHYVNSSISNNILENTLSSVNANLMSVYNGKNLVISNNIMNFIGTTTLSDALLFRNTSGNTVSIYAINNVINGSRWDIRALSATNITLQGNIYGTITGITQS